MSRNLLALAVVLSAGVAQADVPRVAVDIAPVHSLVARVMQGAGEPDLIVAPGASPHEYSLRPSDAAALQGAGVVFWVSPALTPWLEDAIGTLASDATAVELLEADGTTELEFRTGALFEAHEDHDEDEEDHDEGEAGHEEDDHDHEGHDPHAWLSPQNASAWLDVIASELALADPENADLYRANAVDGQTELAALVAEVEGILTPIRGRNFIVFHDAYQYFEDSFDLHAAGAISLSDARDPGPARLTEIRARVAEQGISCVLSEPQFNPALVAMVLDGTEAGTAVLDPLGSDLAPGPELYPQLLRNLATALAGCG